MSPPPPSDEYDAAEGALGFVGGGWGGPSQSGWIARGLTSHAHASDVVGQGVGAKLRAPRGWEFVNAG